MNHNDRTLLLRIVPLVLAVITISVTPALGNSCNIMTTNNFCVMAKILIQSGAEANEFVFPAEKLMFLLAPNILHSWETVFKSLPTSVDKLVIQGGIVPGIYLKNTLYEIMADSSQIQTIIIDETGEYLLKRLAVWNNRLRTIPENISKLTNLGELFLYKNEIETVRMDDFVDLTRLEVLSLWGNRITRIDTSAPISLTYLTHVSFQMNQIENLSIKMWSFPNLKMIHLHDNKLRKVQDFPEHFPKLNETSLDNNRWGCGWLDQTARTILEKGIYLTHNANVSCPEKSFNRICCEDGVEDMQSSLEHLRRVIAQLNEKIALLSSTENQTKEIDFF